MLYPVVIHKDPDNCYGVTIPDIPGCFTAGDSLEEAVRNIQEAVEVHLEDAEELPLPRGLEDHMHNPDYAGGAWMLVDIDLSFLEEKH